MRADAERPSSQSPKEVAEVVLKAAALVVVFGVMVVHVHLWRFSYFSPNIARGIYFAAALWFLLPLVAAWLFMSRIALPFVANTVAAKKYRSLRWATVITGSVLVMLVSFGLLFSSESHWFAGQGWIDRLVILSVFGCLVVAIPLAVASRRDLTDRASALREIPVAALFFYGLIYLFAFEAYVYSEIPAAAGGGRPAAVRLTVDSAAAVLLGDAGIPFQDGGSTTGLLRLVTTTSGAYIIQADSESNVLEVPRGLVQLVHYSDVK